MGNVVSFGLTVAAFGAAIWIVYFAIARFKQLSRALDALKGELASCTSLLMEVRSREEFGNVFDNADTRIRSTTVVGDAWGEYTATLVRVPPRGVIAARRPADFFGPELVYRSGIDMRRFDAVPSQLVGMGLFFTFVGLAVSLWIAQTGMEQSFEDARLALVNLLAASSIKFVTSIVAIGASLWFGYKKNGLVRDVEALAEKFSRQVERLTLPSHVGPMLDATYLELRRQSEILERSDEDLAGAIAAQLDATLRANLSSAISPVADAIREMGEKVAGMNEASLKYIVDRFTQELGSAAREHSARMAELLDQVARSVEGIPERIDAASTRFHGAITSVTDRMEASLKSSGDTLDLLLSSAAAGVEKSAGAFEEVSVRLDESLQQAKTVGEHFSESSSRFNEMSTLAVSQLSDAAERMGRASEAIAPLGELGTRVEHLGEQLIRSQEAASAYLSQVEAAAARMDTSYRGSEAALGELLGRTAKGVEEAAASFENVSFRLNATLETLASAENKVFDRGLRFSEMSEAALSQLLEAAQKIASASEAMAPLGELSDRVLSLSEELARSSQSAASVAAVAERSLNMSQEAAETFSEQARAFTKGLNELEGAVAGVFEQVGQGIEVFRSRVEGAVGSVDDSLATAVDRLSTIVEGITERSPGRSRAGKGKLMQPESAE